MKFTFKKEAQETGLAGVGRPWPNTIIKHNKKEVGLIVAPTWQSKDNKWFVRMMVNMANGWKWVQFKARFDKEPEARQWVQENVERALTSSNLTLRNES